MNIMPNTDLRTKFEVIVTDCNNKTTKDLFGIAFVDLTIRCNNKINYMKNLMFLSGASSFLTIYLNYTTPLTAGNVTHYSVATSGLIQIMTGAFHFFYDKQSEKFLDGCISIKNFYNSFQSFKNLPDESQIVNLFTEFEKIKQSNSLDHLNEKEKSLFQSAGKLLLMDAIVEILKTKKINSSLINQWDNFLTSPTDFNATKLWQTVEMEKTDESSYFQFVNLKKQFKSVKIAEKMVSCFKEMIEISFMNSLEEDSYCPGIYCGSKNKHF